MLAGDAINLVAELADVRAEVVLDGVDSLVGLTNGVVDEELERGRRRALVFREALLELACTSGVVLSMNSARRRGDG
jgi:hypothetical protein